MDLHSCSFDIPYLSPTAYFRPFFQALEILWNLLADGRNSSQKAISAAGRVTSQEASQRTSKEASQGASKDAEEPMGVTELALQAVDQLDNEESITCLFHAFLHQVNEVHPLIYIAMGLAVFGAKTTPPMTTSKTTN